MITMFLNNVSKSLKVHTVGIKRPKPPRDANQREITCLENEELKEVGGSQVPWRMPS